MTGRGLRGRRLARAMIAFAGMVVVLVAWLMTFATPTTMYGGRPFDSWITWAGVVGVAIGLAWMMRVYRASMASDAEPSPWRSHRS